MLVRNPQKRSASISHHIPLYHIPHKRSKWLTGVVFHALLDGPVGDLRRCLFSGVLFQERKPAVQACSPFLSRSYTVVGNIPGVRLLAFLVVGHGVDVDILMCDDDVWLRPNGSSCSRSI